MASKRDKEIVDLIEKSMREGVRHKSAWRTEAKDDFDFEAGRQWSDVVINDLEDSGRVPTVLNYISRAVRAIVGMAIEAPVDVTFFSRKPPNGEMSAMQSEYGEITTQIVDTYRDNSNALDEELDAYRDCVICGEGWTETRIDYDSDPEGTVLVHRIDPLEMIVDPTSKRPNYDDSKFRAHVVNMSRSEFKNMFPDVDVDEFGGADQFFFDAMQTKVDDPYHDYTKPFGESGDEDKGIQVIQYQWFDKQDLYKLTFPDGRVESLTIKEFNEFETNLVASGTSFNEQNINFVKIPQRYYHQVFYAAGEILNKSDGPDYPAPVNGFSFNAVTGFRDRNKNIFYGIVRMLKDPQRTINKSNSQLIHILNTNAKGGLLAEMDAFANTAKAEEEYSRADSITWLNPGGLGKIQQKQLPGVPQPLMQLLQLALEAMTDIPGINLEVLGLTNRNQPNALEDNRKESSATILADLHKTLRRYRRTQAKIMLAFIRDYISDGRLIRITGPSGVQFMPILRDQLAVEYDLVVGESAASPNTRLKTFRALTQILPMALQSGIPVPPDVIDYAPLPETLRRKWKEYVQQSMTPPEAPPPDPMMQRLTELEVVNRELDARKKQADTVEKHTQAQLNQAKAFHEVAVGHDELAQAEQKSREPDKASIDFLNEQIRKQANFELDAARKERQAIIKDIADLQSAVPQQTEQPEMAEEIQEEVKGEEPETDAE